MAFEFDDRWLDVDFPEEARKADRVLGLIEPTSMQFGASLVPFEERFAEIPQERWDELIEKRKAEGTSQRSLVVAICDQNGEPSCTSNATCQSHQIRQAAQFGKDRVIRLSPISVYRHVGSRNSGSSVDGNADFLKNSGALPLDNEDNRSRGINGLHPHNGYGVREPSDADEARKYFRATELIIGRTFTQFVSMLLMGMGVVYGRQGHAICSVDVQEDSRGRRVYPYANSWHESWGDGGFAVEPLTKINWSYGAWAVRTPTE
jgi:hypothetical protein